MKNENTDIAVETPDVQDRTDVPGGFWSRGWPVLALAIMLLIAIRACLPSQPPQPLDAAGAKKAVHENGAGRPASLNASDEGRFNNRRIELAVTQTR
jgi:hypothetical protein